MAIYHGLEVPEALWRALGATYTHQHINASGEKIHNVRWDYMHGTGWHEGNEQRAIGYLERARLLCGYGASDLHIVRRAVALRSEDGSIDMLASALNRLANGLQDGHMTHEVRAAIVVDATRRVRRALGDAV